MPRANKLKKLLKSPKPTLGLWVTMESPTIAEIATFLGLDWIVVDMEHGHLDYKDVLAHIRTTSHTETTPLVRIPRVDEGVIKRVLDIGAEGIVVPMIRNAGEVRDAVRFAKYPPQGIRGLGGERATRWGMGLQSYAVGANRNTLVIAVIETKDAADNFDEIIAVKGLDAVFFGPYDLAASMGHLGQWGHPDVWPRLDHMRRTAQKRRMPVGIVAPHLAEGRQRVRQGFNMIAVGFDTHLFIRPVMQMMEGLGRKVSKEAWDR